MILGLRQAIPGVICLLATSSVVGCVDELPVDVVESGVITVTFESAAAGVMLVGTTDIVDLIVSLDGVRLTGLRARLEALDTTALAVRSLAELPDSVRDSHLAGDSGLADSLDVTITAELSALRRGDTSFRVRFDSVFGTVGTDTTVNVFIEERWQSVSAGVGHTCAVTFVNAFTASDSLELPLRRGGEAFCWGVGVFGALGTGSSDATNTPANVRSNVRFKAVSSGGRYTCSSDTDGLLHCWGDNFRGALGIGNRLDQFVPRLTALGVAYASFDVGSGGSSDNTTCATTAVSGVTLCWGSNLYGQLGCGAGSENCPPSDSSTFWVTQPNTALGIVVVDADSTDLTFSSVSVGNTHACGIFDFDGAAYCWGHNDHGELGVAAPADTCDLEPCSRVAVPVEDAAGGPSALRFISLSAGGHFTCGVTTGGEVYCWGKNREGQLGDGSMNDSSAPVPVTGTRGETFTVVDTGFLHACALTDRGRVYCWGENSSGQLGDGTLASRPMADSVVSDVLFGTMTVGDLHTCGITDEPFELRFRRPPPPELMIPVSGEIYCWGSNSDGQLGNGTDSDSPLPVRVKEPNPFIFF